MTPKRVPLLIKLLFSIFIFFLALEISARFLVWTLKNKNEVSSNETYTILTLGESTTADAGTFGGYSWPRKLQENLIEHGLNIRVVNEATPGTTTTALAAHLNEYYEKYKPQMVITMMGVNDSPNFWYKNYDLVHDTNPFELKSFRILKLLYNLPAILKQNTVRLKANISASPLDYEDPSRLTEELKKVSLETNRFKEIETQINDFLKNKTDEEKGRFYAYIAHSIQPPWGSPAPAFDKTYYFHRLSLSKNIYLDQGLEISLLLANILKKNSDCKSLVDAALNAKIELSDVFLNRVSECLPQEEAYLNRLYASQNINFEYRNASIKPTRQNYEFFYNFIEEKGICWIAMEYPRRSASDILIDLQKKQNPLVFILENKVNFINALRSNSYEQIFSDNFATDFGHTTEFGSKLIADNVATKIQEISLSSKCHLPSFGH